MGTLSDDCGQAPNTFDMVQFPEKKTAANRSRSSLVEPKAHQIGHRCTVEYVDTDIFCNRPSVDHAPFPICARHARQIWHYVDDLIAAAGPPPKQPAKGIHRARPWDLPRAHRAG